MLYCLKLNSHVPVTHRTTLLCDGCKLLPCACLSEPETFRRQVVHLAHTANPCLQESDYLACVEVPCGHPAARANRRRSPELFSGFKLLIADCYLLRPLDQVPVSQAPRE